MTLEEDSYTTVSWQPPPAPAAVVPHQQNFVGRLWKWFSKPPTGGPAAIILIRLMAGGVFFWEGILKFVYHNQGGGRFALIGIPLPETMATFVALFEIVGGVLLISGLFTRWITVPVHRRDVGRHAVDEDRDVPRNLALAVAGGATEDRPVGGVA
jgi:hypothetical protein